MTHYPSAMLPAELVAIESLIASGKRQQARRVALGALACGLTADAMAWLPGLGLNFSIYLLSLIAVLVAMLRTRIDPLPRSTVVLLTVAGAFAVLISVRDSEELTLFNVLACVSAIGLALFSASPVSALGVARIKARGVVQSAVTTAFDASMGALWFLAGDARLAVLPDNERMPGFRTAVRASAFALVVGAAFVALLSAGDPLFRNTVQSLFLWNGADIVQHMAVVAAFAWPVAGLLWSNSPQRVNKNAIAKWSPSHGLRGAEVTSSLAVLNVVFAAFVALQFRALFGGQEYVLATTGLPLAEYARNGFFTLIVTAALVLVTLLLLNSLSHSPLASHRASRWLSASLLLLTSVVLSSSAVRMTIYMQAYGASLDRMHAMAAIASLALIIGWFGFTVLRNWPEYFAIGSVAIVWTTLLALNVANPDAIVARNHLTRAARGERFDVAYLSQHLSADAVPAVIRAQVLLPAPVTGALAPCSCSAACSALPEIVRRWASGSRTFGAWNWGRWRAAVALHGLDVSVVPVACRPAS